MVGAVRSMAEGTEFKVQGLRFKVGVNRTRRWGDKETRGVGDRNGWIGDNMDGTEYGVLSTTLWSMFGRIFE
jgi:hypothetical protein